MRKLNTTLLILLMSLSFFLTPQIIFASTSFPQHERVPKNGTTSELRSILEEDMQPLSSLSLLLSLDKDTYIRQETIVATVQFFYEQTPIPNAQVTLEVDFPNGTSWFIWGNTTNKDGFSRFDFLLALTNPSGKYTVYSTAYKEGLGTATAARNFTILNLAPDVAITNVAPSSDVVTQGDTTTIDVDVANEGITTETFTVALFADKNTTVIGDEIIIGNQTIFSLANGTSTIVTFTWNTTDVAEGNHTMSALASSVQGEINLFNNIYTDVIVKIIPLIELRVIIDQALVSDNRTDINSSQWVSFHAKWLNGSDVIGGNIYVNETAYSTNKSGWITIHVSFDTVVKGVWTVTGVSCNGIVTFQQTVSNPWIIWDRVKVILDTFNTRIDVGTNASITWTGAYEYDSTSFYGSITLSDTTLKDIVGKYCFTVQSIQDAKYDLAAFTSNSIYVIFDRVSITLSIDDSHIDLGSEAALVWTGVYEYNLTIFGGTVTLNDTDTIKTTVGRYGFVTESITDPLYGITTFTSNEVHCIWDQVDIILTVNDNRIDLGSTANITWTSIYEYDDITFNGMIGLNGTLTKNVVGKYGYKVKSISDPIYGLTVFSSNAVFCIWDMIKIFEGGVSRPVTNITQTETAWFKAKYEYDGELFDERKGLLFINNTAMTWSTMNGRWECEYGFSTIGNRTFLVSGVLDTQYDIASINDIVGPLSIIWVELVYYIPRPPSPGQPIIINAATAINATIIIDDISKECMLLVRIVPMPGPPPDGSNGVGKPIEINATGNPAGQFRIRIYYSEEQLTVLGIDEKTLKIHIWDGSQWIPIVSSHINHAKNYVEAVVNHFSTFGLIGSYSAKPLPRPLEWIALIVTIAVAASISLTLILRKRGKKTI